MSSTYQILNSSEVTPEQEWQATSSSFFRWKNIKLAGSIVLTNLIGLGAITFGAKMYLDANTTVDECHIKFGCTYDKYNHTFHCTEPNECDEESALVGYMSGVATMAIGVVVEIASPFFIYVFDKGRRDLVDLNTPETVLSVRDLILNSPNPRYFANAYSSKLPDLVALGIFPKDSFEEFNNLLQRYDLLMNRTPVLSSMAESEAISFEEDWLSFQNEMRRLIPNPITV